jgi:hypothetical protein
MTRAEKIKLLKRFLKGVSCHDVSCVCPYSRGKGDCRVLEIYFHPDTPYEEFLGYRNKWVVKDLAQLRCEDEGLRGIFWRFYYMVRGK